MKCLVIFSCRLLIAISLLILADRNYLLAQGDGPRTFLLAPKGLWGINPKGVFLNQNFLPSGDILIKNADINVNVVPTTVFHTFSIGGRFAQAMFMINPGSANGRVIADVPGLPAPHVSASGFGDGFVGLKVGLIGAPALNFMEFAKHVPAFTMNSYFRVWYSGTYDSKKPLNLGTHRTTFEFGFPMAIPLSKNVKRATWLEVYPSVRLYTTNNNPTLVTQASKSHQVPLYLLENHLTHNFSTKFWAGLDLRYQYGGALELDDIKQDNNVNVLGGGVTAGYQALPFLGFSANYGAILAGDNEARSNMFRISAVFIYVNTKKLKARANPAATIPVEGVPAAAALSAETVNPAPVITASVGVDTDNDGIPDSIDKCPRLAGIADNMGCPEMIIYYSTAVDTLNTEDKLALDKIVAFLQNNPEVRIIIEGHTSTQGAAEFNQRLSEKRAANSLKYLLAKGIAQWRLKSIGYGDQFPVGDNSIEEGRAKSRRTVIRIAQ